ncbi:MAG: pyridoxamine 5'-phosphate oxidase family protein [Arenicella sp.]
MTNNHDDSPFHAGEQAMQDRLGIRQEVEDIGRRLIRSYMPDQHRDFFEKLPFMVVGSVDEHGWPWTSIITGSPGFAHSPEPTVLTLKTPIHPLDPLNSNTKANNAKLGLLGIEPATRRRNRMNAAIHESNDSSMTLRVDQSFGNCPKYIHTRDLDFVRDPSTLSNNTTKKIFTKLDENALHLIATADTFFVSSYVFEPDSHSIQGVDASHRGGKPGFIHIENNSLTIPDYYGNNLFNTLGNFLKNPKAGLLFTDFITGNVLMLTGTVELRWEDDASIEHYHGAERAWTFHLNHGFWLTDFLPFRAPVKEYSPFVENLGDWKNNISTFPKPTKTTAWNTYKIERIERESSVVKSFYLTPTDRQPLPQFKAGQFLPVRLHDKSSLTTDSASPLIRTYTLSSAPHNDWLRISVKREKNGQASQWLHDQYLVGDTIECQPPRGDFVISDANDKHAVLLAGGIGITPMLSIVEDVTHQNRHAQRQRKLTIFHASKSSHERAFYSHMKSLESQSDGAIHYVSILSDNNHTNSPETHAINADHIGRLDAKLLQRHLRLDDYDFYICGPAGFMQSSYDALISLGISDSRIHAEAFGPAELTRQKNNTNKQSTTTAFEAETASIQFMRSSKHHEWTPLDSTLLEVAEQNNIDVDFSCRSGSCGSCATRLIAGDILYKKTPTAPHQKNEVLICCAVPKKGTPPIKLAL